MNTVTAYGSKGEGSQLCSYLGEERKQAQKLMWEPVCCAPGLNKAGLAGTE